MGEGGGEGEDRAEVEEDFEEGEEVGYELVDLGEARFLVVSCACGLMMGGLTLNMRGAIWRMYISSVWYLLF